MRTARGATSRKVRQEGVVIRITGSLLIALLVCGCSGKAKKDEKAPPKKDEPEKSKRIYTGPGSSTVRDTKGDRPILYVIHWEKTQLDYTLEKGASGGRLEKVTGELYQEGKLASTFSADAGFVDKAKNFLKLEGAVRVQGIEPKATLNCRRMEWYTDKKLLKAYERVTIQLAGDGKQGGGTIGPLDEMWCRPKLDSAGTPGFFKP